MLIPPDVGLAIEGGVRCARDLNFSDAGSELTFYPSASAGAPCIAGKRTRPRRRRWCRVRGRHDGSLQGGLERRGPLRIGLGEAPHLVWRISGSDPSLPRSIPIELEITNRPLSPAEEQDRIVRAQAKLAVRIGFTATKGNALTMAVKLNPGVQLVIDEKSEG